MRRQAGAIERQSQANCRPNDNLPESVVRLLDSERPKERRSGVSQPTGADEQLIHVLGLEGILGHFVEAHLVRACLLLF